MDRSCIAEFKNRLEETLKFYKSVKDNPCELENFYKKYPYFFVSLHLYLKNERNHKLFSYESDGMIVSFQTFTNTTPDDFVVCYAKAFLGIDISIYDHDNIFNVDMDYNQMYKCMNFFKDFILADINKLNNELSCFGLFDTEFNDDNYHYLYMDKTFIAYMLTPLLSKEYNDFFERLYKKSLLEYHLKEKNNEE